MAVNFFFQLLFIFNFFKIKLLKFFSNFQSKAAITKFYPNAEITGTKEEATTGNFDVDVDGDRVWSKKGNDDGLPTKNWEKFLTVIKNKVQGSA